MTDTTILLKKLQDIHEAVKTNYEEEVHLGTLSGLSGLALFQFYYSKYLDQDEHAELATEILSFALDKINEGYNYPTYCNGLAGLGWAVDHLVQEDFLEVESDEMLSELDEFLYETMIEKFDEGMYDLLHGALGYGFYFFKRYKCTESDKLRQQYQQYLLELLKRLGQLAEQDENGWKWKAILPGKPNPEGYDLSLSHGMSSIINFLSSLYSVPIFQKEVEPLLKGAIQYVLTTKRAKGAICYFPSKAEDQKAAQAIVTRVAWCYGDLGIAFSLWKAAKVLQDSSLEALAISIFENEAEKRKPEITNVLDAGFCHGSFGNAHIFNKLYKELGNPIYQASARYWIEDGLAKANHKDGFAGFKQWNSVDQSWEERLLVLEGVAGIGLAIIDYLSDYESNWEECLLLN